MNNSYCTIKSVLFLLATAFLFSSTLYAGSSTPRLAKIGFNVQSVSFSGPGKIAKGKTETYTIHYSGTRVKEAGVDPSVTEVLTYVSLDDKDGFFRGGDDLLSYTKVTIPTGKSGTVYSSSTTLQLKCTSKNKIRGVGAVPYGNGKSGEKKAEVYATTNGITSSVKDVSCK